MHDAVSTIVIRHNCSDAVGNDLGMIGSVPRGKVDLQENLSEHN
jgi:hypothetical protein